MLQPQAFLSLKVSNGDAVAASELVTICSSHTQAMQNPGAQSHINDRLVGLVD